RPAAAFGKLRRGPIFIAQRSVANDRASPLSHRTRFAKNCGPGHPEYALAGRSSSFSPVERNFNFAARAVGWELQVDGTAELMRDEIADEAYAITGWDG